MKFTAKLLPLVTASLLGSGVSFAQNTTATQAPFDIASPVSSDSSSQAFIADELVAIIGNAPIMLSEVERVKQMVIEQRRTAGVINNMTPMEEAVEALMVQKLLSQQGKADSLDKEMNLMPIQMQVEDQVNAMIEQLGSAKELEKMYGKAIFQIKKDLEQEQIETQIAQEMQSSIKSKVKVTNVDVRDFFSTLKADSLPTVPVQYVYAQIVKSPPQTEARKMMIRERLLGFRKRILAGEKLSVLARLYSQDPGTKSKGGEDGPRPLNELVAPFASALEELKPGQISEVVETEFGFHLIELIDKKGDIVHYRHLLLKPEFDMEEIESVTAELDSIRGVVERGEITFATAALRHSDDKVSRNNGGRVYNVRAYEQSGGDISKASTLFMADELALVAVEDYMHLSAMKVGDVSTAYEAKDEKGGMVYKMVTLESIVPAHTASYDLDYNLIEQVARMKKEADAVDQWVREHISDIYVYLSPEYSSMNFEFDNWATESAKNSSDPIENHLPSDYWQNAVNGMGAGADVASREVETGVARSVADELIAQEEAQRQAEESATKADDSDKTKEKADKPSKREKRSKRK